MASKTASTDGPTTTAGEEVNSEKTPSKIECLGFDPRIIAPRAKLGGGGKG